MFRHWPELMGGPPVFTHTGFVNVVGPEFADHLRRNVEMLRGIGINTTALSPDELARHQPQARVDDIGAAAHEPDSGYASPVDVVGASDAGSASWAASCASGPRSRGCVRGEPRDRRRDERRPDRRAARWWWRPAPGRFACAGRWGSRCRSLQGDRHRAGHAPARDARRPT